MNIWRNGLVVGLVFLAMPALAQSNPVLELALLKQADGLAKLRATALACNVPVPADETTAWEKAKAMIGATASANLVSPEVVTDIRARLAATPAETPDCHDERLREYAGGMAEDWVKRTNYLLEQVGFRVVTDPPKPEAWAEIERIVAEQAPPQTRLLNCLAVYDPVSLPGEIQRWDKQIGETAQLLVSKGFDRVAVTALLTGVASGVLWKPLDGEAAATLLDDCDADQQWIKDWLMFNHSGILRPIETLVGAAS